MKRSDATKNKGRVVVCRCEKIAGDRLCPIHPYVGEPKPKVWVKICFESEGVVLQQKFESEFNAKLFAEGAKWALEALDDDSHAVYLADEPAQDEEMGE